MNEFAVHFLVLLLLIRHILLAMHPTPLCRKKFVLKDGRIYQKESEQIPSDAGGEVVIF